MKDKRLYLNCYELPIWNFFEIIKTEDLSLLVRKNKDVDKFKKEDLFLVLTDIIKEYNELTDNNDLIREYRSKLDIELLEYRYNITKKILQLYLETESIEVLLTLKELQWVIDTAKPINPQIKRINANLIGIKNKINIAKSKFINKFKKEQKKDNPNFNLEESIVYLEINIPLNYKINTKKDSIGRFIAWNKAIENKNKKINNG